MTTRLGSIFFSLVIALLVSACPAGAPSNGPACDDRQNINCPSGQVCVDFECHAVCQSASDCGPAEACLSGACQSYAQNCQGDSGCADGFYCSTGACQKKRQNGFSCIDETGCASGFCADGVCCESACLGTCVSCNGGDTGAGSGACEMALAGRDPRGDCTDPVKCNGAGSCDILALGEACTVNTECTSNHCTDGVCCESACGGICEVCSAGTGACDASANGTDPGLECGAYECDGSRACVGGAVDGVSCGQGTQCASGYCIDGVCCDTTCGGLCQACTAMLNEQLGASDGECLPVAAYVDTESPRECAGGLGCDGTGTCTPGKIWSAAHTIESRLDTVSDADFDMNSLGFGVAVWEALESSLSHVWAATYEKSSGWQTIPVKIETDDSGSVDEVKVAVDELGNAIVTWIHRNTAADTYNLRSARYSSGIGWEPDALLESSSDRVERPQVALDGLGNGLVVWEQSNEIKAARYVIGSGWTPAVVLETGLAPMGGPVVAANNVGEFVVAWSSYDSSSTNYLLAARIYDPVTKWSPVEQISQYGGSSYLSTTLNDSGHAVVLYWRYSAGSRVFASRRTPALGWSSSPVELRNGTSNVTWSGVTLDQAGNGVAIWGQDDQVWSATLDGVTGNWASVVSVGAAALNDYGYNVDVAGDRLGNAFAIWHGANAIEVARFVPGEGWSIASTLSTEADYGFASIAADGEGSATAVWMQRASTSGPPLDAYAAEYD